MFYREENLWQSVDGSIRSFSAMTDEHLANVLLHITHYTGGGYGRVLQHVQKEIAARGLSEKFLKGAPYPFKDPRSGRWYIWSFEVNYIVPISGIQEEKQKEG
jgi:hypothetical protein